MSLRHVSSRPDSRDFAGCFPPAMVEETAWDILLALRSDRRFGLRLDKLAALVSVHEELLNRWLSLLEDRQLVTGHTTGEVRAVLTPSGRELLDQYLSAATDLQAGTHH
jgi:hypothetical protein